MDPTRRSLACSFPRAHAAMMRLIGLLIATTLESGCATEEDWIDRTLVTVDVTGTWTGTVGGGPPGISTSLPDLLFELERQGSRVTGFMRLGENRHFGPLFRLFPGPMDGTVTGDIFRFQLKDGNLNGELKVSGDEMLGQVSLLGGRPLVLRRGDSSSPPSPPR